MNVITRGIRNAFRNVIRTLSIVLILGLSIGLSLVMLVAHQAVADKISSVKASIGNTISISPAGFTPGSSANNALSASQLSGVQSVAHVASVTETLTDRLTTNGSSTMQLPFGNQSDNSNNKTSLKSPVKLNMNSSGNGPRVFVNGGGSLPANFSLPVTIIGTTDPTRVNDTSITISDGETIVASKDTNEALISTAMASKNNLKVGSTFTAYGKKLTVKGIFKADSSSAVSGNVIVTLPAEQHLSGQSGDITSATVTVDSIDNLDATTTAIKNKLGSSADVTNSVAQADNTIKPLNSVKTITLYSLIGAVAAGSLIILMTMIMIVRERRREIGVIKAIGASNLKIMGQFMVEAVTLTVLGAVVGITVGVIAGNPITKLLVNNSTNSSTATMPRGFGGGFAGGGPGRAFNSVQSGITNISASIGWEIILYGLAAAIIIAILGSAFASFFIAKIRPAEVMRAE